MIPHEVRVRYGETDKMGVVHHSVYALYFEEARTEMMRERGIPYAELEASGFLLPLIEVGIRFRKGPVYDDILVLHARVSELTGVRVRFDYRMFRKSDGQLLSEGHTVHACVNTEIRPRRFPEHIHRVLREALLESGREEAEAGPRLR